MTNEKILIMGDSYSTFEGYVPEGYAIYYPKEVNRISDISQTWWRMLEAETSSEIVLNNSWSGATICNTGYSGDCSTTSSFIFRLSQLIENGFFKENNIDRVLVFGGTNDSWTENACGELKFSDWTAEDLRLILPGICCYMDMLVGVVAKEKIHFIVNSQLREEVTKGIIDICKHYHVTYTTLCDIEKIDGHPTDTGMKEIKNQVLADL